MKMINIGTFIIVAFSQVIALFPLACKDFESHAFEREIQEGNNGKKFQYSLGLYQAQLDFGYTAGRFIGLDHNYGQIGVLAFTHTRSNFFPFLDCRFFQLHRSWSTSIGLGVRWTNPYSSNIWGLNVYWDHRQVRLQNEYDYSCISSTDSSDPCVITHTYRQFDRIGLGIERLGASFDYRCNAYIPITFQQSTYRHIDHISGGYFLRYKQKGFLRCGIDTEIGRHLFKYADFSLYAAAGLYYYLHYSLKDVYGPQLRLQFNWNKYLEFETRYSYDDEYKSRLQAQILIKIPFEMVCRCLSPIYFHNCIVQSVKRNYIPFIDKQSDWKWNW